MKTVYVNLDGIERVKEFVNAISKYNSDFDLGEGRNVIDAKSILGIFTMDLKQIHKLCIHVPDNNIMEDIRPFIVAA